MLASQAAAASPRRQTPAATAPAAPTTAKAPPSPSSLSGPVGTTYLVTDGNGDTMHVRLTSVIDPENGSDEFNTPDNGNRFVGAVFTITGVSGTSADDRTPTPP